MADQKKTVELPVELEPHREGIEAMLASGLRLVKCQCCKMHWIVRGSTKGDVCPPCRKLN